jgi:hypothetical protein
MASDAQLLAALRRELHELECAGPGCDGSDFAVPAEVVNRTMDRLRERIVALENRKEVVR